MADNTNPEPGTLPALDLSHGSRYVPPESGIGERIKATRKDQALLGHKSADMAAIYGDTRSAEWIEVKAD